MSEPVIKHWEDRATLSQGVARHIAASLRLALTQRGRASFAVPGGTTPGPFLRALSTEALDWDNVFVALTDERCVDVRSPRSNARLVQETLLARASAHLVSMVAKPGEQPADTAMRARREIAQHLPLSVCVLGMGADMHTASLFPGAHDLVRALDDPDSELILPITAPGAPEPRITLTAPVLRSAAEIHLLIMGVEKRVALDQALNPGPVTEAPVRSVLFSDNPVIVHYAD